MKFQEVEVRFLEVNKDALLKKLAELHAEDLGEDMLEEVIIYDKDLVWRDEQKLLRLRTRNGKTALTYKHHKNVTAGGTEEIEFEVSNIESAEALLERLGYTAYRHQQKKRHTFHLREAVIDIGTWPRIPTYVEIEGPDEETLKSTAKLLGLEWKDAVFEDARAVIQNVYSIPMGTMTWFTFDRFE